MRNTQNPLYTSYHESGHAHIYTGCDAVYCIGSCHIWSKGNTLAVVTEHKRYKSFIGSWQRSIECIIYHHYYYVDNSKLFRYTTCDSTKGKCIDPKYRLCSLKQYPIIVSIWVWSGKQYDNIVGKHQLLFYSLRHISCQKWKQVRRIVGLRMGWNQWHIHDIVFQI